MSRTLLNLIVLIGIALSSFGAHSEIVWPRFCKQSGSPADKPNDCVLAGEEKWKSTAGGSTFEGDSPNEAVDKALDYATSKSEAIGLMRTSGCGEAVNDASFESHFETGVLAHSCSAESYDKVTGKILSNFTVSARQNIFCDPGWTASGSEYPNAEADHANRPGICFAHVKDLFLDQKAGLCVGNPIYPLNGTKRELVTLGRWLGEPFQLAFDSSSQMLIRDSKPAYAYQSLAGFGSQWGSTWHKGLSPEQYGGASMDRVVQASRGLRRWISFRHTSDSGDLNGASDISSDRLLQNTAPIHWYYDKTANAIELYKDRILTAIYYADGRVLKFTFEPNPLPAANELAAGLLKRVEDPFGRSINFRYARNQPSGPMLVTEIDDPNDNTLKFNYGSNNQLSRIDWASDQARVFHYELPNISWALTGVTDEENHRHSIFAYDAAGRATATERANGVDRYSVEWTIPPQWHIESEVGHGRGAVIRKHYWSQAEGTQVKDPYGNTLALTTALVNGTPLLSSRSQPSGSGCEASSSSLAYDSEANVSSRLGFAGDRTCHQYLPGRYLESSRLEGLSQADACPADLPAYEVPGHLPADKPQRKISLLWHPLWSLEAGRAEPQRIVRTIYNDQPDPVAGGTAHCAPGAPALPDGSAIAVACYRYEQATTDDTGSQGFEATVTATRTWAFVYNPAGQLTRQVDPSGAETLREYWADSVFIAGRGHTKGDLHLLKESIGTAPDGAKLYRTTEFLEYNKAGQPLTLKLPNGGTEQREYHLRGWLTRVVLTPRDGGMAQITQHDHYPTGLLKKTTLPDGSWTSYRYDAAHRLSERLDSAGNPVRYTLDPTGQVLQETYRDAADLVERTVIRTYDALGRQQTVEGVQ